MPLKSIKSRCFRGVRGNLLLAEMVLLVVIAGPAFGVPTSPDNLRLACKDAVSGLMLARHDAWRLARNAVLVYETKDRQMTVHLEGKRQQARQLAKLRAATEFDAELQKNMDTVRSEMQELERQLEENSAGLASARSSLEEAQQVYDPLLTAVRGVFTVSRQAHAASLGDDAYGMALEYKQSCPKYRFVCPLAAQSRENLSGVVAHDPVALAACRKYVDQSAGMQEPRNDRRRVH